MSKKTAIYLALVLLLSIVAGIQYLQYQRVLQEHEILVEDNFSSLGHFTQYGLRGLEALAGDPLPANYPGIAEDLSRSLPHLTKMSQFLVQLTADIGRYPEMIPLVNEFSADYKSLISTVIESLEIGELPDQGDLVEVTRLLERLNDFEERRLEMEREYPPARMNQAIISRERPFTAALWWMVQDLVQGTE